MTWLDNNALYTPTQPSERTPRPMALKGTNMGKLAPIIALAVLVGCASTTPLMRGEQALASSLDVTTELMQADYQAAAPCRSAGIPVSPSCSPLEAQIPGTHKLANELREVYPPILEAANAALATYRFAATALSAAQASKTATADQLAAAQAAETAALGKLNAALANVAIYTTQAEAAWSKWKGSK